MSQYTIQKQIMDLDVREGTDPSLAQAEGEKIYYERLLPQIERFFQRYDRPNMMIELDQLELDLGRISMSWTPEELDQYFERLLELQLAPKVRDQFNARPLTEAWLEHLNTFLRYGSFQWWAESLPALPELLRDLISKAPDALRQLLLNLGEQESSRKQAAARLVRDLSPGELEGLMAVIRPGFKPLLRLIERVSAVIGITAESQREAVVQWLIPETRSLGPAVVAVRALEKAVSKALTPEQRSELRKLASDSVVREVLGPEESHTFVNDLETKLDQATATAEKPQAEEAQQADEKQEPDEKADNPEAALYYVNNAGVVILWPFLVTLFDHLEWTENGEFVDEISRAQAIYALQFMSSGDANAFEQNLTLNKVLCGMPLGAALPEHIPFEEEDFEEMEQMLEAVIGNWEAIGNTSIEGLQQNYFAREGRLEYSEGSWNLLVDRQGIDLLIDKMPWSLAQVDLPWMPEKLYVNW